MSNLTNIREFININMTESGFVTDIEGLETDHNGCIQLYDNDSAFDDESDLGKYSYRVLGVVNDKGKVISTMWYNLRNTELVIVFGKSSFTLKNVDMVDIVLRDGINIGDDFYGIDDRDYEFLITTKETSNKYMLYIICMRTQETYIRTQHKKSTLSSIVDISHNNDITKKGGPATVNIQHNADELNIQRRPNTFIFDNLIATIKKEKDTYAITDFKNQVPTMLPYEGIYQNGRYSVKLGDDTFTNMTQQEVQEALTLELHR